MTIVRILQVVDVFATFCIESIGLLFSSIVYVSCIFVLQVFIHIYRGFERR